MSAVDLAKGWRCHRCGGGLNDPYCGEDTPASADFRRGVEAAIAVLREERARNQSLSEEDGRHEQYHRSAALVCDGCVRLVSKLLGEEAAK